MCARAEPATSWGASPSYLLRKWTVLRELRGVQHVLSTVGDTTGKVRAGEGDVTNGSIYVRMVDLEERDYSQFDVMADARQILAAYPDLRVSVQGVSAFRGGGTRQSDVEFGLARMVEGAVADEPVEVRVFRGDEQAAWRWLTEPGGPAEAE